jgi:hypothetical protein
VPVVLFCVILPMLAVRVVVAVPSASPNVPVLLTRLPSSAVTAALVRVMVG